MAEQRGGEVSYNKKSLNLTQADESIKKIDHSGSDGGDVLFTPEYFEQLNCGRKTYQAFDLNVGTFDIHGGENFAGTASYDSGERVQIGGGATKLLKGRQVSKEGKYRTKTTYFNGQNRKKANRDMKFFKKKVFSVRRVGAADLTPAVSPPIVQMANNLIDGDDDGGIKTSTVLEYQGPFWEDNFYDQFLDLNFDKENIDDDVKREDRNGYGGLLDGEGISVRIRARGKPSSEIIGIRQNSAPSRRIRLNATLNSQDFGRDTNRLDYFRVSAFDVYENDHLAGIASHGGGTRNRGVVVDPSMEAEIGGGIRIRHGPVRLSADNGNEAVVPRLEESVDSRTAGAEGGDRTRDVPVKRLKKEGSTVAMPVAVVVAVAVMMMVMVIVMVVLVSGMVRMEVR